MANAAGIPVDRKKSWGVYPFWKRLQRAGSDLSVSQDPSLCVGVKKSNRQAGITPCDAAAAQGRDASGTRSKDSCTSPSPKREPEPV